MSPNRDMSFLRRLPRALLILLSVAIIVFGLLHTFLTLTGQRPYDQPLFDEPLFAEMSRVAADGGLLYVDQWDHKPPVLFWILGTFITVMGNQLLTIKVATVFVNVVFVAVMTALAWSLTRSRLAAIVMAVLAFGFAAWQGYLEGYNSVFIMATLSAGAMLAAVVARGGVPLLLLSGVLLAFSFFTKQVMFAEGFAALAFAAYAAPSHRRRAALWVVVGGLLGVAWFVGWAGVRGSLPDLWYGSFYTGLLYSFEPEGGAWHFNAEFAGFVQTYLLRQTLPFIGVLLAWSVPALVVLFRERQTRPLAWVLLLWTVTALVGAGIGRSLRRQYFIEMLPPLLLTLSVASVIVVRWRPLAQIGVILLLAGSLVYNVRLQGVQAPPTLAWTSPNLVSNGPDAMTTNEIAEFVSARLEPGECIWNWDGLGYLNYLSGHGACTSAPHGAALMVREAFNIEVNRAEYMRELFDDRPRLHVRQPIWGYFPELERFAERYRGGQLLTLEQTGGFVEMYTVDMTAHRPAYADFDGQFEMIGVDLWTPEQVCAGDNVQVSMTWQVTNPPERYYNTFLQLLTPDQTARLTGIDTQPHSQRPTIEWGLPGMLYLGDVLTLTVPVDAEPGRYLLVNGFYDVETSERLPVFGADGSPLPGDYVLVAEVEVMGC
jgi:hypothetical protein